MIEPLSAIVLNWVYGHVVYAALDRLGDEVAKRVLPRILNRTMEEGACEGPLSPETIVRLRTEFKDIHGGDLEMTSMHPEEAQEERVAHLPRMAMNFNRRNQGRLRQMIDLINQEPGAAAPAAHRTTGPADDDVGGATGE